MRRALAVVLLALASCGGSPASDPYQEYLENNPDPDLILTPEDAQTRALLGCQTEWAEGTVDDVLQEAYDPPC